MYPDQLKIVLRECVNNKKAILIVGVPGIGKTEIVNQIAHETKNDLITMHPAISEPVDFRGMPVFEKQSETAKFVPFDTLQAIVKTDKPTICLIDDFGQANISVQAAAMHLFRARMIGDHKVSSQVTFIICTNDRKHAAGVIGTIEPVKTRMTSIITLEPNAEQFVAWALSTGKIEPEIIGFIKLRPGLLSDFNPTMDMSNSPCPRGYENASDILKMKLPEKIEYELLIGALGEGAATELRGFLKLAREITDPALFLTNPEITTIPENPSILCATTTAVARLANPDNMNKVVAFARRLDKDLQIKLIEYEVKAVNPKNHETKAYIDWAVDNQAIYKHAS